MSLDCVPGEMCRLPTEHQVPGDALLAADQAVTSMPWWQHDAANNAVQSGCDSSDCSYCQGMALYRRPAAGGKVSCWLRRKRSRTDLVALASRGASPQAGCDPSEADPAIAAVVPDAGPGRKQPRIASMWDHALAEQPLLDSMRKAEAEDWQGAEPLRNPSDDENNGEPSLTSGNFSPWLWRSTWQHREQPPAARLRQVATFQRPVPAGSRRQTADIVCAVEFEEHGWLVATAGVAKQVRVFSLSSYLECPDNPRWQQPIRVHRMPSKLSSLAWNPDQPGVVTVGDYDGEVTQIDLETGHMVAEADGHAGRRVWSVSHSHLRSHLCASASEDGCVKLWGGAGLRQGVGLVRPPSGAPICGVQFSPFDEHTLGVACADHSVYVHDLRKVEQPLWTLSGHSRAVSYVRFLARGRLVSASVDGSLAEWRVPGLQQQAQQALNNLAGDEQGRCSSSSRALDAGRGAGAGTGVGGSPQQGGGPCSCHAASRCSAGESTSGRGIEPGGREVLHPVRRFRGHTNSKNFVGLAVRPEGELIACGSETPAAFAYQSSWSTPLAQHPLHQGPRGGGDAFCSAVCWQPAVAGGPGRSPLLAAAMSDGELRVLGLQCRA